MARKRAILITEGFENPSHQDVIFRHDVKINGTNFIEYDIYNSLVRMEKEGLINLKKIFNMLKVKYGLTINDSIDIYKEIITGEENWKIIPDEEK